MICLLFVKPAASPGHVQISTWQDPDSSQVTHYLPKLRSQHEPRSVASQATLPAYGGGLPSDEATMKKLAFPWFLCRFWPIASSVNNRFCGWNQNSRDTAVRERCPKKSRCNNAINWFRRNLFPRSGGHRIRLRKNALFVAGSLRSHPHRNFISAQKCFNRKSHEFLRN